MITRLLLAIFLALKLASAQAQDVCSPPALGHPCALEGVGSQGLTEPEPSLGIGNPVHLATGNKHQQELDLPSNPAAPLLQVLRHYNSLDPRHGAFGRGWGTSYDTRVYRAGGRIQIIQADGSRIIFSGNAHKPLRNRHGVLQQDGAQWVWRWPDGRSLRFDQHGRLTRIVAPAAGALSQAATAAPAVIDIVRHNSAGPLNGAIARVTTGAGSPTRAELHFQYRISAGRAYVSTIETPLGSFDYRYEAVTGEQSTAPLRLMSVRRPDGLERRYLYEAQRQSGMPHLITGIALAATGKQPATLRTHSWAYDVRARAIESSLHHPAHRAYALRITYQRAATERHTGLTVVDGADGRQTRFEFARHAGRYALLKVDGAQCPGCAAPGTRAAYDQQGRLRHINGTEILRNASGRLARLQPFAPGWPGLSLEFDELGRRKAWHANATGAETVSFNAQGRLIRRRFANGDAWHYVYDAQGRPLRITAHNRSASHITRLGWDGSRLSAIRHPHENESRHYDSHGRLSERRLVRSLPSPSAGFATSGHVANFREYVDRFEYDTKHRPLVHHLPEGGALHYGWSADGSLMRIDWHDPQGRRRNVIQAWAAQPGYRYGNGLRLAVAYRQGGARALALYDDDVVLWDHFRAHDAGDRPVREANHFPSMGTGRQWRYAYDGQARLMAASSSELPAPVAALPPTSAATRVNQDALRTKQEHWFAWRQDGLAQAARHNGSSSQPRIERDASGLPQTADGFDLRYGPQRRLEQVRRNKQLLAIYRHNAFGHRIQVLTPDEDMRYFYLDNRVVAELRRPRGKAPHPEGLPITRRYIHAGHTLVGVIDYSAAQPAGTLYAVHTDLLGAPHMVTDSHRKIRWLADYSALGTARQTAGDLRFDPRLPGQVADASTGWHDNLLRTYDPRFGHYLEPDPLGPLPGTQAWGYAGQQPRRYVDPLGLLLFAFDGTRMNAHTRGNVWLLSQRYLDGPVFYHSGPGNPYYWDLDALAAHVAPQTIETQWQHLLNALHAAPVSAGQAVPIDIIGYSRGAALARHFGNLIEQHIDRGLFSYADPLRGNVTACVDLRFMGLFDTVAQFGLGGALNSQYDFSIAAAWGWVAHAVALHERRSLFPLLAAGHDASANLIEAPFIGAHADVGGGVPPDASHAGPTPGDLSDVALNWMLWQARAASVPLGALAPEQATVANPVVHDPRSSLVRSLHDGDRRVDSPDGRTLHDRQDEHARLGSAQRDATEALIKRYEDWHGSGSDQVGTVDLEAYARWLQDELGWHAAPLQATPGENHAII
ncbi:phospholipase effector Tle1 domain-containing protein [Pusillimonas sp.]|uniref:phospholipase effector Tle1 domain-containing protein n=1 Tax=Pusillimonas sp. TaxID=3040095 RepID=UPI0037CA1E0C